MASETLADRVEKLRAALLVIEFNSPLTKCCRIARAALSSSATLAAEVRAMEAAKRPVAVELGVDDAELCNRCCAWPVSVGGHPTITAIPDNDSAKGDSFAEPTPAKPVISSDQESWPVCLIHLWDSVPTDELAPLIEIVATRMLADQAKISRLKTADDALEVEMKRMAEKNRDLHRRCQQAEKALIDANARAGLSDGYAKKILAMDAELARLRAQLATLPGGGQ